MVIKSYGIHKTTTPSVIIMSIKASSAEAAMNAFEKFHVMMRKPIDKSEFSTKVMW